VRSALAWPRPAGLPGHIGSAPGSLAGVAAGGLVIWGPPRLRHGPTPARTAWATGQVFMARHRLSYSLSFYDIKILQMAINANTGRWPAVPSGVPGCWWQASVPMPRWARISGWLGGCGWPGSARADRSFTRQPGRAGLRPVTRNRTAGMVWVNQEPGGGGQQAAACHPGQHRHLMSCYDINGRQPGLASPLPAHSGKPGCQSGCAP
jgi:hypothetical protein